MLESGAVSPPSGGLTLYEQFNRNPRCTRTKSPLVEGWNDEHKQAIVWQPPCNQWDCPECSIILRAKAAIRGYLGANQILDADRPVYFVTVTSHEKLTPGQSWWVLPRAWNKLRTRAQRESPGGLYYAVPEHHKSGKAHLHFVTDWAMSRRWWKDNARSCGLGYQADTEIARSAPGAGAYVLKYLIKQLDGATWKPGKRRIMCSQAWPDVPTPIGALGWKFQIVPYDQSVMFTMEFWKQSGFDVRLLDRGQRLTGLETVFGEISLEMATNDKKL